MAATKTIASQYNGIIVPVALAFIIGGLVIKKNPFTEGVISGIGVGLAFSVATVTLMYGKWDILQKNQTINSTQ